MADGGPPAGDVVERLRLLGRALDAAGGWALLPPPALSRARALFAVRLRFGGWRGGGWGGLGGRGGAVGGGREMVLGGGDCQPSYFASIYGASMTATRLSTKGCLPVGTVAAFFETV